MARIAVAETAGRLTVTVHGRLTTADLKRLEHACGPALEQREPHLDIVLRDGGIDDDAVRAYLERLQARGAKVRN